MWKCDRNITFSLTFCQKSSTYFVWKSTKYHQYFLTWDFSVKILDSFESIKVVFWNVIYKCVYVWVCVRANEYYLQRVVQELGTAQVANLYEGWYQVHWYLGILRYKLKSWYFTFINILRYQKNCFLRYQFKKWYFTIIKIKILRLSKFYDHFKNKKLVFYDIN